MTARRLTSRTQIAICVASLRKAFQVAGPAGEILITTAPGYMLMADQHRIDAMNFTSLVRSAGVLAERGRTAEAASLLSDALDLWRGPVLAGLSSPAASTDAAWLTEQQVTASEQHAALSLELGRHHQIVPRLIALVQEQPLREEARATLMLALYRSGRRSEALALFRQARQVFVEELGLEPGRMLQKLHDQILRDDPALMPPAVATTIDANKLATEFPPDVPIFVGREQELAALDSILDDSRPGRHGAAGLVLGQPGVGKTALAVHWARRVADQFPGGQLFIDLGQDAARAQDPTSAVLGRLLRALGLGDEEIPSVRHERAAIFRRIVDGHRLLILIDNVPVGVMLEEALPKDRTCCLLAISRAQQSIHCALAPTRLTLAPLRTSEAVTLLGGLVGEDRVDRDQKAAEQVARFCEGLPLALAAAAARLTVKQHWTFGDLVGRLRDPCHRLSELSCAEPGLRSAFDLAYQDLKPAVARTYRRLGLLDRTELDVEAGAVWLKTSPVHAEHMMEQLTDAGMLKVAGRGPEGQFRYRMPRLLALHARERANIEDAQAGLAAHAANWQL